MAVVIYTGNAASGVIADRLDMHGLQKTITFTDMVAEKGSIHTPSFYVRLAG
jgi:hypothetical protein